MTASLLILNLNYTFNFVKIINELVKSGLMKSSQNYGPIKIDDIIKYEK